MSRKRAAVLAALAALSVIWGTQYLVIRVTQAHVAPWRAVALRFAVVAVLGQLAVFVTRAQAPKGTLGLRLAMGSTQAISMGLLYAGQQRIASALASVLMATTPIFVVAIAHRWLRERATARTVVAAVVGVAGIALVSGARWDGRLAIAGVALVVGAAMASAISKAIGKAITELPIAVLLRDLGAVVALIALIASLALETDTPWSLGASELGGAVYLGAVASTGANAVYFLLLREIDVSRISYLQFVSACIGLLAGLLLAGERLDARALAGAALVLLGAAVHASSARTTREHSRAPMDETPPA